VKAARSIDLTDLCVLVEDAGISSDFGWHHGPRRPSVGFGFGDLPTAGVDVTAVTTRSGRTRTEPLVYPGQAVLTGDGGFRGGDEPIVRIAVRNPDDPDIFGIQSTVDREQRVTFEDCADVDDVARKLIAVHSQWIEDFSGHLATLRSGFTSNMATLDSLLDLFTGPLPDLLAAASDTTPAVGRPRHG